jgi:3-hydroxyisobutyrate dehydrogenase-like beta-hydroxyacid dehydrogenase
MQKKKLPHGQGLPDCSDAAARRFWPGNFTCIEGESMTIATDVKPATSLKPSTGVIGLGMIGAAVASRLLRLGFRTGVFDTRPEAAASVDGTPRLARSPGDLAREADVILIAVVDEDQTRAVLTGCDGVLSQAKPGATVVLLSTVAIPAVYEFARLAAAAQMNFVDCGVTVDYTSDSPGIVCLVGGDDATIERIRPALDGFSKKVLHFGPLGSGMKAKIARNVINYGFWRISYEAGQLAEKCGLDLGKLVQAVRAGDPKGEYGTAWIERRGTTRAMAQDDPERAFFSHLATLQRKDLKAALALAETVDADLSCTRLALEDTAAILGLGPAE